MVTCKTHKSAWKLGHRSIHASSSYLCLGMAKCVTGVLLEKLVEPQYAHSLRDSETLYTQVRAITCDPNYVLMKVDVKVFFHEWGNT